jgi:hypothetical protein
LPASAATFVERVAERSYGGCFCMLREEDQALDAPGGAARRRANLARYLDDRRTRPLLLVGEAMGYNGGRFSGIAFTAERTLLRWGPPYETSGLRPEGYAEQSGTIVHGLLDQLGAERVVLLWNVVPAHPHRPGAALSNRTPTSSELRAGADVLGELVGLVRPRGIVPVGRSAERALRELGIPALPAVRHPANGGATAFRTGCADALRRAGVA